MHSNNNIELAAYNAVQVKLNDKLVDRNMDKEHQICDGCYKALTLRKGIGAEHYSRLYQSDMKTKH
eukprot:1651773-Heterocapsa_arctica.AAC.1